MDSAELELAEPNMRAILSTAKLDVEYVRGEGSTLYYLDDAGNEVPVVDYVGGYASLILGHGNPEITAHAKATLDAGVPIYAQISRHSGANRIATKLNEIIHRETGATEPYYAIFANTGAEAIESAVKHAEFDRMLKLGALAEEVGAHVESARSAVRDGTAVVSDSAYDLLGVRERADGPDGFERIAAEVVRRNTEQASRPPVFLALEGSFHGKLVGSVQLTHNPGVRAPFAALAAQAKFVPFNQPGALAKVIDEEHGSLLDVVVNDGVVEIVERDFPVFCAFLLEAIQGEGGIHPLSEEFAAEIQQACQTIDCPIIIDEIQSGMGRSGAFLASSLVGLRGDYYAFAKSLGGGLAKTSVMLVREGYYRKDFEMIHSSTFAKDGLSCAISLKVLELLEAEDGRFYRQVEERGAKLAETLRQIHAEFPDVISDVRGKGLMLGLEFRDQSDAAAPTLQGFAQAGYFGYVAAGYLLQAHRIRVLPTASAVNTLRFTPPVQVSDADIDQLATALRDFCGILRDQDEQRLFG